MRSYHLKHPIKFPRLIIEKAKWGSVYYLVNSVSEIQEICFNILKERYEQGYYTINSENENLTFEEYVYKKCGLNISEIEVLPKNVFILPCNDNHTYGWEKQLKDIKLYYVDMIQYNKYVRLIPSIIENKDYGRATVLLLDHFSEGEYDEILIECFENTRYKK